MADELILGNITLTKPSSSLSRISMMLWGKSGCGKTTFAMTAPGQKLLINFDPDGPQSVAEREDVTVVDCSGESSNFIDRLTGENPLRLDQFLAEHEEFQTVIVDSATTLAQLALVHAVNKSKNSTLELPGQHGYAARNVIMLQVIRAFLSVTKKHQRHFILICHEDTPTMDAQGVVQYIGLLLSGKLPSHVGLNMSEIWHLSDIKRVRKLAVRPCRLHEPMKTRMFVTNKEPEFILKYDQSIPDEEQEHTIAKWYEQWKEKGGKKLELPT